MPQAGIEEMEGGRVQAEGMGSSGRAVLICGSSGCSGAADSAQHDLPPPSAVSPRVILSSRGCDSCLNGLLMVSAPRLSAPRRVEGDCACWSHHLVRKPCSKTNAGCCLQAETIRHQTHRGCSQHCRLPAVQILRHDGFVRMFGFHQILGGVAKHHVKRSGTSGSAVPTWRGCCLGDGGRDEAEPHSCTRWERYAMAACGR